MLNTGIIQSSRFDRLLYPDSMINLDESCIDMLNISVMTQHLLSHYIVENNFINNII